MTPDAHETITLPELCLVVLIGAAGSGKSTFAARHFQPSEVLSLDAYRIAVADDPSDPRATSAAVEALRYMAGLRLALGRLTVVDATNVEPRHRAPLLRLAREHDVQAVALVFDLDERICREHAAQAGRSRGPAIIHDQVRLLRQGLSGLEREGFARVVTLATPEAAASARVERVPLAVNRRQETGPFDLIGDIHGCYDELRELLALLGYTEDTPEDGPRHPDGRRVIFLGDLVDRGPGVVEVVDLVRRMVAAGRAFCVPGNHDAKLLRYLIGHHVQISHGLQETLAQLNALPRHAREAWSHAYRAFVETLPSHYVLEQGALVVAHAGMKEVYQGRESRRVHHFALYGETTGEVDEHGLPIRLNWAADYRGSAAVVYGHTPVAEPVWLNNTINIDTGCVFGGRLSALRWPERELLSVPARRTYAVRGRPFL
jgi:protein phosphatase